EFAGNNVNIDILEKNIDLFKGKKIGFGCIDSAKNEVDSYQTTEDLISRGINIVGEDNILLDPDCGLRRAPMDVAFDKLKLMNDIKDKYQ
ncbi:MAG: methionine synthase, partial [Methanobrevibacter sp.]|nr:methionine synthase [Methanobrevibacter sp.]